MVTLSEVKGLDGDKDGFVSRKPNRKSFIFKGLVGSFV